MSEVVGRGRAAGDGDAGRDNTGSPELTNAARAARRTRPRQRRALVTPVDNPG